MIPVLLIEELAKCIRSAVKDYKLQAEGQADKPVTVYEQHISEEDFLSDTYYPLVVVSLQKVEDGESKEMPESYATVGLTVGCYGEDKRAWQDTLNIMERIRQSVLKKRTIGNRFRLRLPTKWETIEGQPYPFWYGYGTLVYTIAQPVEEMEY